jgi:hypothetical protein
MKSVVLGCVCAVIQILPGLAAQEPKPVSGASAQVSKPALQLILSPDHITVTSDSDFDLPVTLVNQSPKDIWCNSNVWSSGIDEGYTYDIRVSNGEPVKRFPGKEKESSSPYPSSPCALGPGYSVETTVGHLMRAFVMNRPGVYTVQISRRDPTYPVRALGTSNVVTVTVVPKNPNPAGAADEKPQPLTLAISGPQTIVEGDTVMIKAILKNVSNSRILFWSGEFYTALIHDQSAKVLRPRSREGWSTSSSLGYLEPGMTFREQVNLSSMCDLSAPGRYFVRLSRPTDIDHTEGGAAESNEITISVVPKQPVTPR